MSPTEHRSFNLIDRPWVPLRFADGSVSECTLAEVYTEAHEAVGIGGEITTQEFAIIRLLLAILHRAVDGPVELADWTALWQNPTLPAGDVDRYLAVHRDRFDLLHPLTPFFQVADLHSVTDQTAGLEKLIADIPDNIAYFSTRSGSALESVDLAEATRWLIHLQAYDPSGIKTGALGDPRVKGGKGYPIGTGWCGALGGILIEGATLRETLLLNLMAENSKYALTNADDLPVWERDPQSGSEETPGGRSVHGALDAYTWQARRVRLVEEHGRITSVLICNGDRATLTNKHEREPMTAWRRSANQEKQLNLPLVYLPRLHDPARALWRGITALLPSRSGDVQRREGAARLTPGVIRWISELREAGALDDRMSIRTHAYGLAYGTQSATIVEVIDDQLSVQVALLAESSAVLGEQVELAVERTDKAVWTLGNLAMDVDVASGGDGSGARGRVSEAAFADLDQPFRSWLATVGADSDAASMRADWDQTAQSIIRKHARAIVEAAPAQSMIAQPNRAICTPEAENKFRASLRKLYADLTVEGVTS